MDRLSQSGAIAGSKEPRTCRADLAQPVASLRADTDTPAPGCAGPARVPGPPAGPVRETGWRQ